MVPCQTRRTASLQKLAEELCFAQPICGKLHSRTNAFQWQFSVSTQCALPTCSQFLCPHHNHSRHTFLLLLILRPWEPLQKSNNNNNNNLWQQKSTATLYNAFLNCKYIGRPKSGLISIPALTLHYSTD